MLSTVLKRGKWQSCRWMYQHHNRQPSNTIDTTAGKLMIINNAAIKVLIDAHARLAERRDAATASSFEWVFFLF